MSSYQISYKTEQKKEVAIALDGSKSISNRLLVLQHLSDKDFSIENLSTSDDTQLMQQFFEEFPTANSFNVQNAGTVTRFVTAVIANSDKQNFILNCAEPMKQRPIKILVDALRQLGADITYLEEDGFLPIQINGKKLEGNRVQINAGVSSQYISALMMIATKLPNGLTIELIGEIASKPYLEITQKLMQTVRFKVDFEDQEIKVSPRQTIDNQLNVVFNESDWSAAAFYYSIASVNPNFTINLSYLLPPNKSSQGDAEVAKVFEQLGVETKYLPNQTIQIKKKKEAKNKVSIDFIDQPDMVPAVAVACAALGVKGNFTGVKNLVIKESNRLKALQTELAKVDVEFKEIDANNWELNGIVDFDLLPEVEFDTYHDHRMAMCVTPLAFAGKSKVNIHNPSVVSKSYVNFWEDMKILGLSIDKKS